jgi:hypothetical protein
MPGTLQDVVISTSNVSSLWTGQSGSSSIFYERYFGVQFHILPPYRINLLSLYALVVASLSDPSIMNETDDWAKEP